LPCDRRPTQVLRTAACLRDPRAGRNVRRRDGGPLMLLVVVVFLLGAGAVVAGYALVANVPGMLAQRKLAQRLQDVSAPAGEGDEPDGTLVLRPPKGPLPQLDRLVSKSSAGSRLSRLIEQSGCQTTPAALLVACLGTAAGAGFLTALFIRDLAVPLAVAI